MARQYAIWILAPSLLKPRTNKDKKDFIWEQTHMHVFVLGLTYISICTHCYIVWTEQFELVISFR